MKYFNYSKKLLFAILFTVGNLSLSFAQDTLVYHNNDKRIIKLYEIGLDEIKFRNLNDSSDVIRVIEKIQIKEIRLANHEVVRFLTDPLLAKYSDKDLKKQKAIKLNFLSPMFNCLSFSFENVLKPWVNMEVEAGVVGLGVSNNRKKAQGVAARGGIKFISKPSYKLRGQGLLHPLQGSYVKPELIFSQYSKLKNEINYYPFYYSPDPVRFNFTNIAFNLNIGKQGYYGSGFLVDTYIGIGYGVQFINGVLESSSSTNSGLHDGFPYTHAQGNSNFPISFTFGIRLGFAL